LNWKSLLFQARFTANARCIKLHSAAPPTHQLLPLPLGLAWQAGGTTSLVVWTGFAFGWGYLFAATFAINHFDLFGLRPAWFAFQGLAYEPVVFKEIWMYPLSRHPIMVGVLIGIWCIPTMTNSQLMLALGMSLPLKRLAELWPAGQ
jgi:hypothetical protein